jgi:integrase
VAANRELALFSHIWNKAREWGYTSKTNPCAGVSKNKETPRDFYADDEVWQAVRVAGVQELRDAMDLAYLTGQRPADVLKITRASVTDTALMVKQGKTAKMLSIQLDEDGERNALGQLLDTIKARKVSGLHLLMTAGGLRLNKHTLRLRFQTARALAAEQARAAGNGPLAERIELFQFRDARPKAASEIDSIAAASELLGHSKEAITRKVYVRVGQKVKPTR